MIMYHDTSGIQIKATDQCLVVIIVCVFYHLGQQTS
jgi:hypothetical protein